MDYMQKLKYHYRPKKGWVNDPNGLVYYKGYYHLFYQHVPNFEYFGGEGAHWGHARTKDFLNWEELPIALYPDEEYDDNGCWSGTAIVKDDVLYLFYASVRTEKHIQTISMAYSTDGIHFEKHPKNPLISEYPSDGSSDFRDPAVCRIGDIYYCVIASGHRETETGRLLLYKSSDLISFEYQGVMKSWEGCKFAECPSFVSFDGGCLLASSTCTLDDKLSFKLMFGNMVDGRFVEEASASVDKGPDQYAGQLFRDHRGRNILISWFPGWRYMRFKEKDIGCFTIPKEITLKDGVITAYPVEELRGLLKDEDPAVERTESGFVIKREGRDPVIYEGEINEIKLLKDEYMLEVFVNGGTEVYTVLL